MAARRRTYHHGDLKAALIAAAIRLVEERGAEAVSFRAIARGAGVSQTAPYNHFRSKQHLLATVAAKGFDSFTAMQRAAAGRTRAGERRLVALARAYVAFASQHPQLYRLMFGVGLADWKRYPEVVEAARLAYVPVQEALAALLGPAGVARRSRPPDVASIATWALVHGVASLLIDGKLGSTKLATAEARTLAFRVTEWYAATVCSTSRPAG